MSTVGTVGTGGAVRGAADRAVTGLAVRLVRRGALLLVVGLAVYAAVEVASYLATYPDAASRARLLQFQDDPAVRMLQGVPRGVQQAGGFVVWDGGWVLQAVAAVWMLLTAARLLRGEEESGRSELVLAAPVRAGRAVLLPLLVLAGAALLVGAAPAVVLLASGQAVAGSVLFGLAVAGFAATFGAVAAVASQLFEVRRRAVGVAAGALGAAFLLRMVANSGDSRGWLRWVTPFGWTDELRPFGGDRWFALVPMLVVPVVLGAAAVLLRRSRDIGGALLRQADRRRAQLGLLGGPTAFAWRSTRGLLVGWMVGVCAYALVIGSLARTFTELMLKDPNYRRVLEQFGVDVSRATVGFVSFMGGFLGVLVALQAVWRIGAARGEESAGRLELVLTRPVSRWRWLGGHALLTLAASVLLAEAAGLAMWAGAVLGDADLGVADALASVSNALPVVVLFAGLSVLLYGALPRLALPLAATAVVVGYLVELLGPELDWPAWVLDASPFHHLAQVPAESFAALPAVVMASAGLAAALAGGVLFHRRDLAGA